MVPEKETPGDDETKGADGAEGGADSGVAIRLRGRSRRIVESLAKDSGLPKTAILAIGALALERELGDEEMLVQMPELGAILAGLDAKVGDLLLEVDYARKLAIQALSIETDLPLQLLGRDADSGVPDAP